MGGSLLFQLRCKIKSPLLFPILQYIILCGHPPFYAQSTSTEEIMEKIKGGKFSLDGEEWLGVSSSAKDIIKGICVGMKLCIYGYSRYGYRVQ